MENQDPKRLKEKTLSFEEHQKLHEEYWISLNQDQKLKLAQQAVDEITSRNEK